MIRLLCQSRLDWTLGGEYLLVAVRQAIDDGLGLRLDFVGEGTDYERLLFTVHDLSLQQTVYFQNYPRRNQTDPRSNADILVLPLLVDDPSPETHTALTAGLPFIGSDLRVFRNLNKDGQAGLLVPTRDPAALAVAIKRVALEPMLLDDLTAAARRRAAER